MHSNHKQIFLFCAPQSKTRLRSVQLRPSAAATNNYILCRSTGRVETKNCWSLLPSLEKVHPSLMHTPTHKMRSGCGTATTAKTHHSSYRPAPLLLPVLLLLLFLVSSLCAFPVSASLQILRPLGLQHVVQHTSWSPYGPAEGSGRPFRGSLVWIPNNALCSSVDEVVALDEEAAYPKPVAHFGVVNYSDVEGAIGLFTISSDCPMLNQLFYVEAVLGVSGAVVHSPLRQHLFPPLYSKLLTAPITHLPAVAVKEPALEKLRSVVVDKGVEVEVQLGWCTSEMFYS